MYNLLYPYVRLALGLALVYFLGVYSEILFEFFHASAESHLLMIFFVISALCVLSFLVFYMSAGTILPGFVIAIFFGMVGGHLIEPVIHNEVTLGAMVGFGATLILFGGGVETPWGNFKKLLLKILSLSFVGLFLTAGLFSWSIYYLGMWLGMEISITTAILLGAVLASTDPAAIIPILRQLKFKNKDVKYMVVSESAVTDVTGTLLTVVFLSLLAKGQEFLSIEQGYGLLFTMDSAIALLKQIGYGVVFGVAGYILLETLTRFKQSHDREFEVDAAFFLFVPVIIFTLALAMGGSGYLAAFITGLLFVLTENLHHTEEFFNQVIEGFLKPSIFLLLGALVDIGSLLDYALLGILASLVFMFLIRPLSVMVSLIPFMLGGKEKMSFKEILFISFVRETGAIPAVLLITITSLGFGDVEGLLPIGMWVILSTLIIQPPLTPLVAKKLGVATELGSDEEAKIETSPFVVLGSRSHSYVKRLPRIVEWASNRGIKKIVLLHCLEDKFSENVAKEEEIEAYGEIAKLNKMRQLEGKLPISVSVIEQRGKLEDNLQDMAEKQNKLVAFFVGKKMLDFRFQKIKNLGVPVFFVD